MCGRWVPLACKLPHRRRVAHIMPRTGSLRALEFGTLYSAKGVPSWEVLHARHCSLGPVTRAPVIQAHCSCQQIACHTVLWPHLLYLHRFTWLEIVTRLAGLPHDTM